MGAWARIIAQITFLWTIFMLGNFLVGLLKLPLPGNVLGMLILFALLSANIVPVRWIEDGAGILLKHLAFFFIPIAVGLMSWSGLLMKSGVWLVVILIISAALSIPVTGWVVQVLNRKGGEGRA